ncbi:hypothetical protein [Caenispirillum salinarum]|uniref:hypothetical protein n=1 Tax=Caenispirillum salinarum TaxID=859058 RepID=UPI00384F8865
MLRRTIFPFDRWEFPAHSSDVALHKIGRKGTADLFVRLSPEVRPLDGRRSGALGRRGQGLCGATTSFFGTGARIDRRVPFSATQGAR